MIGMDFGANDKLTFHGDDGPVDLPRMPSRRPARTQAEKTAWKLEQALALDDVTTESASVGSSGLEPEDVRDIVERSPHTLYLISTRRVKNLTMDRGIDRATMTDKDAARFIHEIATRPNPELKVWKYVPKAEKFTRIHTTVRPHDKRDYRGPVVDAYMEALPPFGALPEDVRKYLGNGDYSRPLMLPFAMAFDEDGSDTRAGYTKIIGLYADGYPSFYRRATVLLMQTIAKAQFEGPGSGKNGTVLNGDISPEARKAAWRETTRVIRTIYAKAK